MLTSKMNTSSKSQAFYGDFVISIFILVIIIIIYFEYIGNLSNQNSDSLSELLAEAKIISSSLTGAGAPANWNTDNVARIGFVDAGNKINNAKYANLNQISYNKTKRLLGTTHDFFLFFENESQYVQNVEGYCGIGSKLVNITYDLKSAYLNECPDPDDPNCEQFLKSFMQTELKADYYCSNQNDCPPGMYIDDLINNLNNYDFVVLEHPALSQAKWNNFKASADSWLMNGGLLFIGGQLPSAQSTTGFDVEFRKKAGQSESDRLSTVIREDEFLAFEVGQNIIFRQAYYVVNQGVDNGFTDIVRFNGTYVHFNDIKNFGDIAIARWLYGEGKIFFFSDFDANYFKGNFAEIVKNSAKKWANAVCLPINIAGLKRQNLVRLNRLVVYKSDILKMVLYVWS